MVDACVCCRGCQGPRTPPLPSTAFRVHKKAVRVTHTHTHTHDSLESGTLASALRSPCPFVDACKREPISHLRIKWNGLSNSGVHSNVWMLSRDCQHQLLRDFLFCDRFRFVSLTSGFQDAGHSCPSSSTGNSRGILMAAFSSRFGRLQHLSTQLTFR